MAADVVVVTDAGMDIITNRLKGSGTEPKYVHWGTGTTGAAAADTALETARAEDRTDGTSSRVTTTVTNDTYQVAGTITAAGSSAAITEAGLFDASTDGNMLLRGTFDAINLQIGDSIAFTVKVKFDQA
jgi:hypothetical protein